MSKKSFLGDKPINRIGFGAMQLAGPGVFGPPSDPEGARAVLRRAVELGVDHIDTSQYYGPNVVNELIREALHPYPEQPEARRPRSAVRRDDVRRLAAGAVTGRTARRRRGQPANPPDRADRPRQPAAVRRARLRGPAARAAGRARGSSPGGQARPDRHLQRLARHRPPRTRARRHRVRAERLQLVNRGEEDELSLCEERGLAFVPFFPLGSAFAGGPSAAGRRPGDRRGGGPARSHAVPDRAGVAAAPVRADPADPGHAARSGISRRTSPPATSSSTSRTCCGSRAPGSSATRWPPRSIRSDASRARRGSLRLRARRWSAGGQAPRSAPSARGAGAACPASGARASWSRAGCRSTSCSPHHCANHGLRWRNSAMNSS